MFFQKRQQRIHLCLGGVPGGDKADTGVIFIDDRPDLEGNLFFQRLYHCVGQNGEELIAGTVDE